MASALGVEVKSTTEPSLTSLISDVVEAGTDIYEARAEEEVAEEARRAAEARRQEAEAKLREAEVRARAQAGAAPSGVPTWALVGGGVLVLGIIGVLVATR
jgi:LPS O-antigen subunit length determinant protein (WzzB/FepE family)